jgi:integrase/recombinase XerD
MARKLPTVINQEEFEKIFSAEQDKEYKLAFLLGFEAGMRISEIVGYKDKVPALTRDRVDSASIKIISGKGGKDRVVPRPKRLNENALKLLPIKKSRRALQWEFKRLSKKVLGKDLHFHTLRHGFCSHLIQAGRPINEVQMLAGHSRLDTTGLYLHANPVKAVEGARDAF